VAVREHGAQVGRGEFHGLGLALQAVDDAGNLAFATEGGQGPLGADRTGTGGDADGVHERSSMRYIAPARAFPRIMIWHPKHSGAAGENEHPEAGWGGRIRTCE